MSVIVEKTNPLYLEKDPVQLPKAPSMSSLSSVDEKIVKIDFAPFNDDTNTPSISTLDAKANQVSVEKLQNEVNDLNIFIAKLKGIIEKKRKRIRRIKFSA